MKKLSVFISMALCLVIGGVYAAWAYPNETTTVETTKSLYGVPTITTDTTSGAKGVFDVDPSNLKITIDDANNDYIAEVSMTGYLTVTFTPAAGADESVKANGLPFTYRFSTGLQPGFSSWTYEDTPIFSVDTISTVSYTSIVGTAEEVTAGTANTIKQEVGENHYIYTYTITADQLNPYIGFFTNDYAQDGTLVLSSKDAYDEFKTALHAGYIQITITEAGASS